MANSDCIYREAAINEIKKDAGCDSCSVKMLGCCLSCSAGKKIRRIEQMPAADVVEIVRCKDCKHRDLEDKKCDCGGMPWDTQTLPVPDDWFCPNGERVTNNEGED